jgi:hypothetical protein
MFTKTMKLPNFKSSPMINSFNKDTFQSRKIYNTLTMLIHLLNIACPEHHFKLHLLKLIDEHSINIRAMGFPDRWEDKYLWKI